MESLFGTGTALHEATKRLVPDSGNAITATERGLEYAPLIASALTECVFFGAGVPGPIRKAHELWTAARVEICKNHVAGHQFEAQRTASAEAAPGRTHDRAQVSLRLLLPLFPACTHADCSSNYKMEESPAEPEERPNGEAGRPHPTRLTGGAPAKTACAADTSADSRSEEIRDSTTHDSATTCDKPEAATITMSGSDSAAQTCSSPMYRRGRTRREGAVADGQTSHFQSVAGSRMRC